MSCDVTWENDMNEHGDIGLRFLSQSRVSILVNPDTLLAGEVKARAFLKIKNQGRAAIIGQLLCTSLFYYSPGTSSLPYRRRGI